VDFPVQIVIFQFAKRQTLWIAGFPIFDFSMGIFCRLGWGVGNTITSSPYGPHGEHPKRWRANVTVPFPTHAAWHHRPGNRHDFDDFPSKPPLKSNETERNHRKIFMKNHRKPNNYVNSTKNRAFYDADL